MPMDSHSVSFMILPIGALGQLSLLLHCAKINSLEAIRYSPFPSRCHWTTSSVAKAPELLFFAGARGAKGSVGRKERLEG